MQSWWPLIHLLQHLLDRNQLSRLAVYLAQYGLCGLPNVYWPNTITQVRLKCNAGLKRVNYLVRFYRFNAKLYCICTYFSVAFEKFSQKPCDPEWDDQTRRWTLRCLYRPIQRRNSSIQSIYYDPGPLKTIS